MRPKKLVHGVGINDISKVDELVTSIKGNLRKYSNGHLTVQLSFLEDENDIDFQSFAWM